ncbi:ATP-dependent DNA helicase MER3 [Rhodotorula sphaerocarpa]
MFGEAGEEGIWEEGGEPFEDASRRDGPERAMFGEPDEYGFVDPMSPSPVANARFPRSGVLGSTAHGSGWTSTNHTSPSMSTAAGRQLAPKPSQSTLAPSRSSYSAYPHAPTGVPPDAMSRTMIPSGVRGREGGGIIRPMPVRPATGAPARNNLSTAPVGAPQMKLQQKLHHSRTQHNQPTTAQREDEEQYWQDDPLAGESGLGAGDMLDAWDDAFASLEAGPHEARREQRPLPATVPTTRSPQENPVQYLEDLEALGREPRPGRDAEPTGGTMRRQDVRLKPVSSLPDMFRSLWRFGVFNAVQSICFDSVYGSDEHVVVSAPTGAGKTVLFELAVLRVLTNPASSESKVLYMAPTKSLCSERVADWKKKFEHGFGWTVQELTGDSDISNGAWRDVAKARIIVTTPEKWDAMTRKWHDHCTTLGQLRLFWCVAEPLHEPDEQRIDHFSSIDEVHSVGSVRGAVLEVVSTPGSSSNGGKQARVFQFDDNFRPCKLQKVVVGYPRGSNDFAFAASLSFKLYDLIKQYSSGKPVLVFCNTRKGCTQAAEALLKAYKEAIDSKGPRAALAWPKPRRVDFKTSDRALAVLLEAGLAVHHAGMEINDRKLVERLFTDGGISVVCSTSTLAVGVNLPARMVIIKGTKGFVDGQMRDYTDLDILQMIGRAGRPQFDTLGIAVKAADIDHKRPTAVIMTEKGSEAKYSQLVNAQTRLESCLHNSLTEHVNSEIALGTIGNVPSALRWLRSTFLFVRIHKNRAYYGLDVDGTSPEQRLEEFCLAAIEQLVQSGLVERDGEDLAANHFSDIMSKFYISYQTFLAIKTLPVKSSMRSLLSVIAQSSELSSYRFRQGEKSIMILIQLVLDGVPGSELKTESTNPMLDARAIFIAATRIAKCMVDVAVEREDGAIRTMLEL